MAREAPPTMENKGWLYQPAYPGHWARRPLYSLAQWVNGLAFRDIQFSPTGMPVIKIAEVKGGISGQTKFTEQTFDDSVRVRAGDLLFSWSGQPETSIDAFWWRGPEGWLNQHVFRVTPADGIDPTFFFYLLRYLKPNFVGIARNKQTTGLGHVTKRDLENIEAAYPGRAEQRAIAHILGTLDDKIELNRQMSETLEAMARAVFKSWFVDFDPVRAKAEGRDTGLPAEIADLFPDAFEETELGEVPSGWAIGTVTDAFCLTMGQSPPGSTYNESGDGIPFYQGKTDFGVRYPARRVYCTGPTRFAEAGDVLVTVRAPVGSLNIAEERCAIGRGLAAIRHNSGSTVFTFYSMAALHPAFAAFEAEGTVFGSIGKSSFQGLPIVVPPDALVAAFERIAAPLESRIAAAARESTLLAALRDLILPKLITGELAVSAKGDGREVE